MGFFDTYEDGGNLNFVGKEEKGVLIANATPFPVLKVTTATTQFGEKFNVHTELEGEERVISFGKGSVESRDRMLEALQEYLLTEGAEAPQVYMEQVKQSILLRGVKG